jgi:hypothetical protein
MLPETYKVPVPSGTVAEMVTSQQSRGESTSDESFPAQAADNGVTSRKSRLRVEAEGAPRFEARIEFLSVSNP